MSPDTTYYSDGSSATGVPTDQLVLYDTAIKTWLETDYDIIPGKKTNVLISTPQTEYGQRADISFRDSKQQTLSIPRITIQRGDHVPDPTRFNPNTIRYLGRVVNGNSRIKQGQFPVPISIPYQIDFWPEFVREMNLWEQKLLFQFAYQYKYFSITVDSDWGTKKFIAFLEGAITDQSDLEPGERTRQIRRVANIRVDGWLYDQSLTQVGVVKRVFIEERDYETETLWGTSSPNRRQTLYTSPGGQTIFSGSTLDFVRVLEKTFVLSANFTGVERVVEDDGAGNLFGPNVASGTIDYDTGAVSITYSVAPDAGDLLATWLTDQS